MTTTARVRVRPLDELDLTEVVALAEKLGGSYDPRQWEDRVTYYLRRDPEGALAAEVDGRLVGFMLGEVRSGEFGLEEPTGWIEVMGVDPELRGQSIGRHLAEGMFGHFRARGASAVRTLVDDRRPDVESFFASLGFEPAPQRPLIKRL